MDEKSSYNTNNDNSAECSIIAQNEYPSLRIDQPSDYAIELSKLDVIEDNYKLYFSKQSHHNYIVVEPNGEKFVVSFLCKPISMSPPTFRMLETTKKGSDMQDIEAPQFICQPNTTTDHVSEEAEIFMEEQMEQYVRKIHPNKEVYYIPNTQQFSQDFLRVEEKHPQKRIHMKIGLIYCKNGQSLPKDMFANTREECGPRFEEFLNLMGELKDLNGWTGYAGDMGDTGFTYYHLWDPHNIEIVYHVAPMLNPSGHRQWIGNDIAVMFFLEEGSQFNPMNVDKLGTVPQLFAIVRPENDKYRLGFFSYSNIKKFIPDPPTQLLDPQQAKTMILTKMHNGLVMANRCPPMNRLYFVPRGETMKDILEKYNPETKKDKKNRQKEMLKMKSSSSSSSSSTNIAVKGSSSSLSTSLSTSSTPGAGKTSINNNNQFIVSEETARYRDQTINNFILSTTNPPPSNSKPIIELDLSNCALNDEHISMISNPLSLINNHNIQVIKLKGLITLSKAITITTTTHHLPPSYVGLKRLDLTGIEIRSEILPLSRALKTISTITTLSLRATELTTEAVIGFSLDLEYITSLTSLDISLNSLSSMATQAFSLALHSNTSLLDLNYGENNLKEEEAIESLASAIRSNPSLTTLDLFACGINSDGITVLADALTSNKNLKDLLLSRNKLSDYGASRLFKALETNNSLTKLILDYTFLSDTAISSLTGTLKMNTTLKEITLSNNREITEKGGDIILNALRGVAGVGGVVGGVGGVGVGVVGGGGSSVNENNSSTQRRNSALTTIALGGTKVPDKTISLINQMLKLNSSSSASATSTTTVPPHVSEQQNVETAHKEPIATTNSPAAVVVGLKSPFLEDINNDMEPNNNNNNENTNLKRNVSNTNIAATTTTGSSSGSSSDHIVSDNSATSHQAKKSSTSPNLFFKQNLIIKCTYNQ
eukprot:TRINITY_DN63_c0_g2_i3.p1 TRINITY_DN63_c0_g2~~TRINITY_DN63_c0_g2_i3.p1  ORF type:complete len:938 (-),score=212.57 TRINITY_DN63_c0_g2_i3:267-3080(-)